MMTDLVLRYLAWEVFFSQHKLFFVDWLDCTSDDKMRIIFNSKIHDCFYKNLSDCEIFDNIMSKKNDLFSQSVGEPDEIKIAFENVKSQLSIMNQSSKSNYLISIDSFYPSEFLQILQKNLNPNSPMQYIPIVFQYIGEVSLLTNKEKKAIIGTRHPQSIDIARQYIQAIYNKYPNSVCVTGLASGIDSLGVSVFDRSICFIGENLTQFSKREQKDLLRFQAKEKCLKSGLILSHIISNDKLNAFSAKQALLDRNLFIVLLSNTVHPIEYSFKSGTISAINHAVRNHKLIYSPKALTDDFVQDKYRNNIVFY